MPGNNSRVRRAFKLGTPLGNQIDFLAAYVIPRDAWYIIPVSAFDSIVSLNVAPHRRSNGRFEQYREAWDLFHSVSVAPFFSLP